MFRGCGEIRCRQFTPRAWRGKESHQWLKLTESVLTRIDQESEQLCSRQVEGRALMKLFKRAHGVSAGKREWGFREPLSPRISVAGGQRSGPRNRIRRLPVFPGC